MFTIISHLEHIYLLCRAAIKHTLILEPSLWAQALGGALQGCLYGWRPWPALARFMAEESGLLGMKPAQGAGGLWSPALWPDGPRRLLRGVPML